MRVKYAEVLPRILREKIEADKQGRVIESVYLLDDEITEVAQSSTFRLVHPEYSSSHALHCALDRGDEIKMYGVSIRKEDRL